MGEIADSMIDGEMCQSCGEWLGDATGYPRYCSSCQPSKPKNGKLGKASDGIKAINGVYNYLSRYCETPTDKSKLVEEYSFGIFKEEQLDLEVICLKIQEDFPSFVKWVKNKQNKSNN